MLPVVADPGRVDVGELIEALEPGLGLFPVLCLEVSHSEAV